MRMKLGNQVLAILILTLISTVCSFSIANAQLSNGSKGDVSIHSPNVTNLGKYGDYPIDMSNGVPSIEIPLYTIKSGKLELPLSLSYHASGIKVDQESSQVGLGWVLNAGGFIAKSIRDKDDKETNGFLQTGSILPNYTGYGEPSGIGNNAELVSYYTYNDGEPDLFRISVSGLSGGFCLDNSGNYVSLDLDSLNYSVNLVNNLIIVKDKVGTIYRFGRGLDNSEAFETTTTQIESGGSMKNKQYNSSFYLTEIISADLADTISFKYKSNYYSESKAISVLRSVMNDGQTPAIDKKGRLFNNTSVSVSTTSINNMRIIDKILFRNGSVEFTTVEDRLDVYSIEQVASKARISGYILFDKQRNKINQVIFENNDYFNRTGAGDPIAWWTTTPQEKKKALKLNSVKFMDKDGVFVHDYKFQYDETPLPHRNTTSQDFWGYSNGKGGYPFIPETFYTTSTGQPRYEGVNRNTDFNYMKAASLKKITYPTGASTVYDYEPNYYLNQSQSQNQIEDTRQVKVFAVNRSSSCDPDFMAGIPANNIFEFTVSESLSGSSANLYVIFSDYKVSNGQKMTFTLTSLSLAGGPTQYFERLPSSSSQPLVFNQTISISPNVTYRLEVKTNGVTGSSMSMCNSPFIEAGLSYKYWKTTTADEVVPKEAGGLRVKNISNFGTDGSMLIKKTYEYGDAVYGPNSVGTGTLITDPSKNFYNYPLLYCYFYYRGNGFEPTVILEELRNVLWFSSDSQVELGINNGCPVRYNKITEKQASYDGNLINGKTEYYYNSVNGIYEPKSGFHFPYNTVTYPSWSKPQLTKQISYKFNGVGYSPVKSIDYAYYAAVERNVKILKVIEVEPDLHSNALNGSNNPKRFMYYNFYVPRGKILKSKEIDKDYDNEITNLVAEKTIEYNPYFEPKLERYVNSKGDVVERRSKYTSDLDYSTILSKHMMSLPVQNEETVNGKVRSGSIMKYSDDGRLTETYRTVNTVASVPYTAASSIPSYYERDRVFEYDSDFKNIRSVLPGKSIPIVYLWSYKGEYLIAEIKNASYSVVESALGGAGAIEAFRRLSPTDTQLSSFLTTLRTALPTAQVTSYAYKPFYGMSIQTDAKGQTSYFEYDSFQRLKYVKDKAGNIIRSYDYHYKP